MKIIVPMAGIGKRMRPHTLTVPKPLLPIAGKPIVQRLVEDIAKVCKEPIEEIAFIIGDFGHEVEKHLLEVAKNLGAKGRICQQEEALGTAHAILCAQEILDGKCVIAFADTLFRADFTLDDSKDGIIWVQKVEDPKAFGVVKTDADGVITEFIEKPQEFVSDLAIIGIYYFKDGAYLKKHLQHLIDNGIKDKGEFQLTNALENMKNEGTKFSPGTVKEWLDCGNKDATVYTNQRVLEFLKEDNNLVDPSVKDVNSKIIPPCYIGKSVVLNKSVVGPHVSIGDNTTIENSVIQNSIIQKSSQIKNKVIVDSMIGSHTSIQKEAEVLSVGDYNEINS